MIEVDPEVPHTSPSATAVLVVDDHPENLVAMDAILAPLAAETGVRVILAQSADEALRHALVVGDHLAVVLLDVMMPGTDGPETARLIRQRRQTAHVPVIFVTALDADRRQLASAYESGAVDYLTKPVDPDLLRAKVGAFVALHRRREETHHRLRRRFADEAAADSARAAAQATEARARLAAVLDSMPDAVVTFDAAWRFVYLNPAAAALLRAASRDPDAVLGTELWPLVKELGDGATAAGLREELRRAAAERRVVTFEQRVPELRRWFETRVVPDPTGMITVFARDVTQRVAAEAERERLLREAEEARAVAEQANAAKSRFLATMSHELRTPLNAIAGHVQLVEMGIHGPVTEAQREALGRVHRAQRHLLSLINDVLDYAKLEGGRVEYDVRPTRVADVVASVAPLVEPQAAEKRIAIELELPGPGDLAAEVWADPERLGQVLLNLLSNAVKFTPAGGRLGVQWCPLAGDGALGELRVWDTGIGIAADRLETIFEPFVQAHRGLTRAHEGTGLGLTISRDLARGMGAELSVDSEEGAGSTFAVTLRRVSAATEGGGERRCTERRRSADRREQQRRQEAPGAGVASRRVGD